MKKIIIIDTNVLLDDPKAFLTFKNNDIVIPYKVIEELEKHKRTPGEVGMNARDCSRIFAELLKKQTNSTLKSGIKLDGGNKLYVIHSNEFENEKVLETGDDHILGVCVGIQKEWKNYTPVLVSNDMLLRIRANSFGIKCETYNASTVIHNSDELYTGYKIIETTDEIIARFWDEHSKEKVFTVTPKELTKQKLFCNDFIILTNGNDMSKKPYPILRVKEHNKKKELHFVQEVKLSNKFKCANFEQTMAMDLLLDPQVNLVTMIGTSGTGKTFEALAASLEQVVDKKLYKKLIVIRPTHSVGEGIGWLPGSEQEKLSPWLEPVKDNLRVLYGRDNIDYLINNGTIEMEAMSFLRGRSINNVIMLIDETQNCNLHEIKTILTRVGKNTKIILTGDIDQIDRNDVDSISNGLSIVVEKFKEYPISGHVTLREGLRSELADIASKIL